VPKPLVDATDEELRDELRRQADRSDWSYNAVVHELDRRAASRQARASFFLSVVSVVIAVAAFVLSVLRLP